MTENNNTTPNTTKDIFLLHLGFLFTIEHPAATVSTRFVGTKVQQQGSLGKLPGEIRNRIFEIALTTPIGLMVMDLPSCSYKQNIATGLLSTCQQFSQEGLDLFYRRNTFVFGYDDSKLFPDVELDDGTCMDADIDPLIELGVSVHDSCIKFMNFRLGNDDSEKDGCRNIEEFVHSLDSMRDIIQVHELTLYFCNFGWDFDVAPAMLARALTKLKVVNCITVDAPIKMWFDENLVRLAVELGMNDQPGYITGNIMLRDCFHSPKTLDRTSTDAFTRGAATFFHNIATESPEDHGLVNDTVADDSVEGASDGAAAE